jgi:hypothetical protein
MKKFDFLKIDFYIKITKLLGNAGELVGDQSCPGAVVFLAINLKLSL